MKKTVQREPLYFSICMDEGGSEEIIRNEIEKICECGIKDGQCVSFLGHMPWN